MNLLGRFLCHLIELELLELGGNDGPAVWVFLPHNAVVILMREFGGIECFGLADLSYNRAREALLGSISG